MKKHIFQWFILCLLVQPLWAETLAFRHNGMLKIVYDGQLIRTIRGVKRGYYVGDGVVAYKGESNALMVASKETRFRPVLVMEQINSVRMAGMNVFFRKGNQLFVVTNTSRPGRFRFISDIDDYQVFERIGRIAPICQGKGEMK